MGFILFHNFSIIFPSFYPFFPIVSSFFHDKCLADFRSGRREPQRTPDIAAEAAAAAGAAGGALALSVERGVKNGGGSSTENGIYPLNPFDNGI